MTLAGIGGLPAVWVYLLCLRAALHGLRFFGGSAGSSQAPWARARSVTAIIPARNEAAVVAQSIRSLAEQRYAGAFRIVLVDDDSADGTADIARNADASGRSP